MMMENAKSVSEVARLLQQSIRPLERWKEISLKSATGRICAENIDSPMSLPARNNAAVDGFAFHYDWAINNPEFIYNVVAEIRAGHPFDGPVLQGQAVAIFTGAVVPNGLDCIAMQENCIIESENRVKIATIAKQGLNIRKYGWASQPVEAAHCQLPLLTAGS